MAALDRNRRPTVPGAILKAHYMEPRAISVTALADALGLSRKYFSQIVNGHKRVEPTIAARLALVLGTTPRFWMNLQAAVDEWDASVEIADWKPSVTFAPPQAGNDPAPSGMYERLPEIGEKPEAVSSPSIGRAGARS